MSDSLFINDDYYEFAEEDLTSDTDSFVSLGSQEIILDDERAESEARLSIGSFFIDKERATSTLLTDRRHVGLKFIQKLDPAFIRYTCAVPECESRFRFKKQGTTYTLTVANHEHNHDTSIRKISNGDTIRSKM